MRRGGQASRSAGARPSRDSRKRSLSSRNAGRSRAIGDMRSARRTKGVMASDMAGGAPEDRPHPPRRGLRGGRLVSETLAAKLAELASQALLVLLVPRALGPSAYGEFAVAFA